MSGIINLKNTKFSKPDDLVFANKAGNALDRHNLLQPPYQEDSGKAGAAEGSRLPQLSYDACQLDAALSVRVWKSRATTWVTPAARAASPSTCIRRPGGMNAWTR